MADDNVADILSPTSPSMASAVFGSAPRPRRPSTPKSPPAGLSQPGTPSRVEKALPTVPRSTPAKSSMHKKPLPRPQPGKRPDSPDVDVILARTPRPRRKSSVTFNNPPIAKGKAGASGAVPSSWKGPKGQDDEDESLISGYGEALQKDEGSDDEGSESDSSIDIHTPLPHLMFRDGLLSPRSKLLPGGGTSTLSLYIEENDEEQGKRANSVLSLASTATSTMTKSGIFRDPRDTERRRNRHRDQTLLRAGMGLTTGLGWSDSEDEDAPSLLTRRLITTNSSRQTSMYSSMSRAPSQLSKSTSVGNLSNAPPSYSPGPRPGARRLSRSTSTSFTQSRLSTADTESIMSIEALRPTRSRTQSNASASSMVSSASRDSSGPAQSVTSSQATSSSRATVPRPLRLPQTAGTLPPSVTRTTSAIAESRPPVTSASTRIASTGGVARPRNRTLSNPGSRPTNVSTSSRPSASSRIVPPRSVSTSVMAPVRSLSSSVSAGALASRSHDPLSEFPLPPSSPIPPFAGRPSANTATSPVAAPGVGPMGRPVLNTVGTGPRPRPLPRTGTGMVYRNSSYSSYHETSRISRASVTSTGKEVGVI